MKSKKNEFSNFKILLILLVVGTVILIFNTILILMFERLKY